MAAKSEDEGADEGNEQKFCSDLKELKLIGNAFMVSWILQFVVFNKKFQSIVDEKQLKEDRERERKRILLTEQEQIQTNDKKKVAKEVGTIYFALALLIVGLLAQLGACAALTYSVGTSLADYATFVEGDWVMPENNIYLLTVKPVPDYILNAYLKPFSTCPGKANIGDVFETGNISLTIDADFKEENGLVASESQVWFYVCAVILVWTFTAFDWWRTVLSIKWLLGKFTKVDPSGDIKALIDDHHGTLFMDLTFHVVLVALIYSTSIVAMFYTGSVGKMVSIMFALDFLEQLDDFMKAYTLSQTNLGEVMFMVEHSRSMDGASKAGCKNTCKKCSTFWFTLPLHLFYLCVYGLGLLMFIFLGCGCKPGNNNTFDFF